MRLSGRTQSRGVKKNLEENIDGRSDSKLLAVFVRIRIDR